MTWNGLVNQIGRSLHALLSEESTRMLGFMTLYEELGKAR